MNAACISAYHGSTNVSKSRHPTFSEGRREVWVRCYMHAGARENKSDLPEGRYERA